MKSKIDKVYPLFPAYSIKCWKKYGEYVPTRLTILRLRLTRLTKPDCPDVKACMKSTKKKHVPLRPTYVDITHYDCCGRSHPCPTRKIDGDYCTYGICYCYTDLCNSSRQMTQHPFFTFIITLAFFILTK